MFLFLRTSCCSVMCKFTTEPMQLFYNFHPAVLSCANSPQNRCNCFTTFILLFCHVQIHHRTEANVLFTAYILLFCHVQIHHRTDITVLFTPYILLFCHVQIHYITYRNAISSHGRSRRMLGSLWTCLGQRWGRWLSGSRRRRAVSCTSVMQRLRSSTSSTNRPSRARSSWGSTTRILPRRMLSLNRYCTWASKHCLNNKTTPVQNLHYYL